MHTHLSTRGCSEGRRSVRRIIAKALLDGLRIL